MVSHMQPAGLRPVVGGFTVERIRGHDTGELLSMALDWLLSVATRLRLCISSSATPCSPVFTNSR